MKLKVKDMDISTGGVLISIFSKEDAHKLDLHYEDRVVLKFGHKSVTAVVDLAASKKAVPKGSIGLFEEVLEKLGVKSNDVVKIDIEEKPVSVGFIRDKLDGKELSSDQINEIVKDIVKNNLSAIELTYFVSAAYTKGLSMDETIALTKAIVSHGDQLKLSKYPVFDKHCSGGVPGNRTTMVLVPLLAAAGMTLPKTSSRSITSPAGTADTMEVLAEVCIPVSKMKKIVNRIGACMVWGGAMNLAAADDKLIKIRYPISLDPHGMLLASIMAKKTAVHSTHVLIDIPIGKDTKINNSTKAKKLAKEFVVLGKNLGMKVKVLITDGSQPIGNGIGPALEARDVLLVLMNDPKAPQDLRDKVLFMAETAMRMVGKKDARKKAKYYLNSGLAYKKMKEIIKAQGGNPDVKPEDIKIGDFTHVVRAKSSGKIYCINNKTISKIARVAGAPLDRGAGIFMHKHVGDSVKKGEPVFTIYSENAHRLKYALHILKVFDGVKFR